MKQGLDCYYNSCTDTDSYIYLEMKLGLVGRCVADKLIKKIFSNGYFMEYSEKSIEIFIATSFYGGDRPDFLFVDSVVKLCVEEGIFSGEMLEKYGILTSEKIQEDYFFAVKRRKEISYDEKYLLISTQKLSELIGQALCPVTEQKKETSEKKTTEKHEKKTPEISEIKEYMALNGYTFSAEDFKAYYDDKGWFGNWKSSADLWQKNAENLKPKPKPKFDNFSNYEGSTYTEEEKRKILKLNRERSKKALNNSLEADLR